MANAVVTARPFGELAPMKKLIAAVLIALFATVLYGVVEQHQDIECQRREQAERTLQQCFEQAASNGGAGVKVCEAAGALNK